MGILCTVRPGFVWADTVSVSSWPQIWTEEFLFCRVSSFGRFWACSLTPPSSIAHPKLAANEKTFCQWRNLRGIIELYEYNVDESTNVRNETYSEYPGSFCCISAVMENMDGGSYRCSTTERDWPSCEIWKKVCLYKRGAWRYFRKEVLSMYTVILSKKYKKSLKKLLRAKKLKEEK